MSEDEARGKDWLRARGITCVLQTQFSSFFFFYYTRIRICAVRSGFEGASFDLTVILMSSRETNKKSHKLFSF